MYIRAMLAPSPPLAARASGPAGAVPGGKVIEFWMGKEREMRSFQGVFLVALDRISGGIIVHYNFCVGVTHDTQTSAKKKAGCPR